MKKILALMAALMVIGAFSVALIVILPIDGRSQEYVRIDPDMSFEEVTHTLESRGLLRSRAAFTALGWITPWDEQIKSGCYDFGNGASILGLLQTLRKGEQTPVTLTITSGFYPERVARTAAKHMFFTPDDFVAAVTDSSLAAGLGTDTLHLFSYMVGGNYEFYCNTPAEVVVSRIKNGTDELISALLANKASDHELEKEEVLSLASIVEWETYIEDEKSSVAGVYLNRIQRNWPLQADPTIQFGLLEIEGSKRRLFFSDYKLDHEYNTYLYLGFPPGPITNPSRSSLEAAADPEDHKAMFFVANPSGGHTLCETLSCHSREARKLRQYLRERDRAKAAD